LVKENPATFEMFTVNGALGFTPLVVMYRGVSGMGVVVESDAIRMGAELLVVPVPVPDPVVPDPVPPV
jgi:hypothetical protein